MPIDFTFNGPSNNAVELECNQCDKVFYIPVPSEGYAKWRNGLDISVAMPDLDNDSREFFLSKTCPPCYDSHYRNVHPY